MRVLLISLFIVFSLTSIGQTFEELLSKIPTLSVEKRNQALDAYFSKGVSAPIYEEGKLFFVYRGEAQSIAVAGDATGWQPSLAMEQIPGTNTWYCKTQYEDDARLEYKIILNKKDWILDPLNKRIMTGGTGQNSEIVMPGYKLPKYIEVRENIQHGSCSDTVVWSNAMKEGRPLRIYLPAGYNRNDVRFPVAFFHDGFEFFDRTAAKNILDNMISEKKIIPLIAVFVQPLHRDDEYSGTLQTKYTRFMTQELVDFMDKSYHTLTNKESRAQIGISNGGNIALWLVASQPGITAKAAAMSSNVMNNINGAILKKGCADQKLYLLLGKYDLPVILNRVGKLRDQLTSQNCSFNFKEYPEGHSWKFWQKYLPEALEYLFPVK